MPSAAAASGNQSQGTSSNSGGVLEEQQSPGAQSVHGARGHSPTTSSIRNPTTGLNAGNTATPMQQPQFELDDSEANVSASVG
jgi:hypothetical protein